jgi:hypothetical protein
VSGPLVVEPRLIVDFRERSRARLGLLLPRACSWQCETACYRASAAPPSSPAQGLNTNRLASQPVRPALFSAGSVDQCVEGGPLYMFVFQHRPEGP